MNIFEELLDGFGRQLKQVGDACPSLGETAEDVQIRMALNYGSRSDVEDVFSAHLFNTREREDALRRFG